LAKKTGKIMNLGLRTDIVLLIVVGIVPLMWFRGFPIIMGADFELPLLPREALSRSMYLWEEIQFGGWDQSQVNLPKIPYYFFLSASSSVGIPLHLIEKIVFAALFVLPGLSMYYLSIILFKNNLSRLLGALFYTLNLYTLIHWHNGQMLVILPYAVIPLLLGIFLRGLKKKQIFKYAVLFGLASVLMAPGSRFPLMVVALFLTASLSILYLLLHRNKIEISFTLRFTLACFLMSLIANLWWIIPVLSLLQSSSENVQLLLGGLKHVYLESGFTSFLEVSRLLGEWGWYTTHNSVPYYTFANMYSIDPLLVTVTFLIPVLAWSALLVAPKSRLVLSVSIATIFGVFLSMGTYPPFGALYQVLYQYVPFFWIFRNPYRSFVPIIALGYAILIGALIDKARAFNIPITHHFKIQIDQNTCKFALTALLLVLIVSSTWPFFTGDVIEDPLRIQEIPSYYSQANDYFLNQSTDSKLLLLPSSPTFGGRYTWGYTGPDILPNLISQPQVRTFAYYSDTSELLNYITKSLETGNKNLAKLLSLMGIEYVMIDYSIDSSYYNVTPAIRIEQTISSQTDIRFEREFEQLKIYRNLIPVKEIFATRTQALVAGGIQALESLLQRPSFDTSTAIFFLDDLDESQRSPIAQDSDTVLIYRNATEFQNNSGWRIVSSEALGTHLASYGNATVTYEFNVPKASTYELWANVKWNETSEPLKVKLDDGPWSESIIPDAEVSSGNSSHSEIIMGTYQLPSGIHKVTLTDSEPLTHQEVYKELRYVALMEADETSEKELGSVKLDYIQITPTLYKVLIESNSPFFLVFLQSYAPSWRLIIDNEETEGIRVNGFANAFYVSKSGKYEATLEYTPQRLFEISALGSIVLQIAAIFLLISNKMRASIIGWSRRRHAHS